MAQKQSFGLGRGLSSLIPRHSENKDEKKSDYFSASTFESRGIDEKVANSPIFEVSVEEIKSNKHQPRKFFAEKNLQELANSIREHGILQPLVVVKNNEGYELVAGERRLRASKIAGFKKVPVIVRDFSELEMLELALIENIQRSDLNLIEEAHAYQKLNDEFGLTHEQIAKRVGKSRPVVSNAIRLLSLPEEMQQAISEGKITEGHAKVLMEIKDSKKRDDLFQKVLFEKLTITDTSNEVQRVQVKTHARTVARDPNIESIEEGLREALGTKVLLRKRGKNGGVISIEYYGEEELKEVLNKLLGRD
jgi:ParB family transcriptional regulator, chromosome partitioning protein